MKQFDGKVKSYEDSVVFKISNSYSCLAVIVAFFEGISVRMASDGLHSFYDKLVSFGNLYQMNARNTVKNKQIFRICNTGFK